MRFLDVCKHYLLPSPRNAYRPRLLHKEWLFFFLLLVFISEGFYLAGVPEMTWFLGGVAAGLGGLLLLAFWVHVQVQPTHLLGPGLAIFFIALTCLTLNGVYFSGGEVLAQLGALQTGPSGLSW